jgi:small Trp-rich protein
MPLIVLIAVLVVLRFFEVWRFAQLSWWWIGTLMAVAFVWFEFIEKMLGRDKKKQHDDEEKRRRDRLKNSFGKRK